MKALLVGADCIAYSELITRTNNREKLNKDGTKTNIKAFALASALVCGIIYIICALLSWISPAFIVGIGNYLAHSVDLTKIMRTGVTLSSAIIGLILTLIIAYLIGGLFAWVYNRFSK